MAVIDIPTLSVNAIVNFASTFNVTSGVNGQTGPRDRFIVLAVSISRYKEQQRGTAFNVKLPYCCDVFSLLY